MKVTIVFLLISVVTLKGQNLVPNPSFETIINESCGYIRYKSDLNNVITNWFSATDGTPDIYSSEASDTCVLNPLSVNPISMGKFVPRSGKNASGIIACTDTKHREYLEVELKSPLQKSHKYYAEYYVLRSDSSDFAGSHLGMCFSTSLIDENNLSPIIKNAQVENPTTIYDRNRWVRVAGMFRAQDNLPYLTIGVFEKEANIKRTLTQVTNRGIPIGYYFVDDVFVKEFPCMVTRGDELICKGEHALLEAFSEDFIGWAEKGAPNVLLNSQDSPTNSKLYVYPKKSTTYLAYSTCDTMEVHVEVDDDKTMFLGGDTTLCPGEILAFDLALQGGAFLWSDGSSSPVFTINQSGMYYAEVQNRCGSKFDTISVNYHQNLEVDLGNDIELCEGSRTVLKDLKLTGDKKYLWQDGTTLPQLEISEGGRYILESFNTCGTEVDSVLVTIKKTPKVGIEIDTVLCNNESILIELPDVIPPYEWDDTRNGENRVLSGRGTYEITVSNECGSDTAKVIIREIECGELIEIPSAFTPNNDGVNDFFYISGLQNVNSFEIIIYNRWGARVFENINQLIYWDGTYKGGLLPAATYYYVTVVDGERLSGSITLLR